MRSRALRSRVAVPLLVLVAALGVLVLPVPARADDVAQAEARVRSLQRLQEQTTAKLLEGTRAWEADRTRLARTRVALRNARRHVRTAEAQLAGERDRVAAVVAALYRNPAPHGLQLAFSRTPDEVLEAMRSLSSLDRVAGGQAQVIARAATARLELRRQQASAVRLAHEADALAASSRSRLSRLQALAQSTGDQLAAAQSALAAAREAEERRKAAAAAARARAARSRSTGGGALCTGRSAAGQSNGNLDPASLCPLWGAPGHRLVADAAAAFNRMSRAYARDRGAPLCVTDSYRSYSEQVDVYRRKPGLAAVPGTSEHGWGRAVDFCGGVEDSGSRAHRWMQANSRRFGWFHPSWAEPSGSRPEPWHWEYGG